MTEGIETFDLLDLSAADKRQEFIMHSVRRRFLASRNRFDIIPAGRRSGKTEEARWRLIAGTRHRGGIHHGCLTPRLGVSDPTYVYAAPVYAQAKRIVWERLKAEVPRWAVRKKSESELYIDFVTGSRLYVAGMDRPERVEGIPIDGAVLDEYADMKVSAWESSIRPALSTKGRPGWALFIGRPRGKNHFHDLYRKALTDPDWGCYYPWPSWLVLDPEEIEQARRDLDDRSFRQEYGGEFLDGSGNAYYMFGEWNLRTLQYDPNRQLQFSFDFNSNPGVAVVSQDMDKVVDHLVCWVCKAPRPGQSGQVCRYCQNTLPYEPVTAVIGEVFRWEIGSNTRLVCQDLIEKWGHIHHGSVVCYGDASGGQKKSSSERSDWQTVEDYLSQQWPVFEMDLSRANPGIRDRVVVMNSRLRNASGESRIFIDPECAPNLIQCLEKTGVKKNGDMDPGSEKKWSHISDAISYQQYQRFGSPLQSAAKQFEVEML